MTLKGSLAGELARGNERRLCTKVFPPPYMTEQGVILVDRRSYLDRRSNWIRSYSFECESFEIH